MIIFTTSDASEIEAKLNTYLGKRNNITCWIESEPDKWKNAMLTGFSEDKFIILTLDMKIITLERIMIRNEDLDAMNAVSFSEKIVVLGGIVREYICNIFRACMEFVCDFFPLIVVVGFIGTIIFFAIINDVKVHVVNAVDIFPPKVTTVAKFGGNHLITYDATTSRECADTQGECSISDTVPLQAIYSYLSTGGCYVSIRIAGKNTDYYKSYVLGSQDPEKCKEYLLSHPIIKH